MPPQSTPETYETTSESDSSENSHISEQYATRLNTINLLSTLVLRREEEMERRNVPRTTERGAGGGRGALGHPNRYSSVYDNELNISNQTIPIQIRNIDRVLRGMHNENNDLFDEEFDDDYEEDMDDNVEDSFDERFDDYDDDDDSDDGEELEPENLRSDIQSNERLLLSSARQNHTNTNTLISSYNDAIPLRRQNAIRVRSWLHDDERAPSPGPANTKAGKSWLKELNDLHFELFHTQNFFKYLKVYPGRSPIFNGHSNHAASSIRSELPDDLIGNLDSIMDLFLQKRVSGKLWSDQEKNHTLHDKILLHKRKNDFDEMPAPMKKKKKLASGNDLGPTNFISSSNNPQIRTKAKTKAKAKLNNLTYAQKHSIMDVTYSSFLTSGSSFTLNYSFFNVGFPLDLVFSAVDYRNKALQGIFSITPITREDNYLDDFAQQASQINSYQEFFLGINPETLSGPRDKLIMKQLKILKSLDAEIVRVRTENGRVGPKFSSNLIKPFTIPVVGKIIDFKNNDLRFLTRIRDKNHLPMRCLHLARTKSNRVRLQLLEWMKIQPFAQFEESFFLEQLNRANINLEDFKSQNASVQKETIDLARGLRDSMYDLTKFFGFIRSSDIPIPLIENERFKRRMSYTDYKKTYFLQEWEKKLTDRLVKFVTCQEHCLLNIQLNYILFTLTIDICQFLNNHIEYKLNFVSEERKSKYQKQLKNTRNYKLTDSKKTILLCSLDRKTGRIEIQNSRALLDYKNVYQLEKHANSRSSSADQDDGALFHRFFNGLLNESPPPEGSFTDPDLLSDDSDEEVEWEDPYHEASLDTVLKGHYKKTNNGNVSFGGGNLSYSIV